MKKTLIASVLMLSTIVFARTEKPKNKIDSPEKDEKVLVAKKSIKEEKTEKKIIIKKSNTSGISPSTMCFIYESVLSQILIPYIPDYGKCIALEEAGF